MTTLLEGRNIHHCVNQVVFIVLTFNALVRTGDGGFGDFQLKSVTCRNKQKGEDHTKHVEVKLH